MGVTTGRTSKHRARRLERLPATLTVVLVTVGLVMVYSASSASAVLDQRNPLTLVGRQSLAAAVGVLAYMALSRARPRALAGLAGPLLVTSLALMLLVLVPSIGVKANGARRWIDLGVTQFQPSELAKLALVLWIAGELARRRRGPLRIGPVLVATAVVALLVVLEPDLGTAMVVALTATTMLYLGGARSEHIIRILLSGAAAVGLLIATVPYMRTRLLSFVDPWSDAQGSGFQTIHAMTGIGAGGWFGVGPGNGIQKISYLPEAHTDMIAATIGEEFGLVGFGVLIALFAWFTVAGFRVAFAARRPVDRYAAGGLTTLVAVQATINLGAVLGLLPITGVPLPFISYGGTSLVVFLAASGIIVNIARASAAPAAGRDGVRAAADSGRDRRRGNGRARRARARGGRRATPAWR